MATSLVSDDCTSVAEANELFETEKGLLVLRPGRGGCCCCPCSMFFSVPSGCYALVTEHGADLDFVDGDGNESAVWPPGLHYPYPPWVGVSHLVTKQSVVLDLPVKACKTKDNITVNVDVALVFRIMGDAERGEDPKLVRKFVYEVKPQGLEQQLWDAQEEAVRALARSMKHTEIYGIRSGPREEGGGGAEEVVRTIEEEFESEEETSGEDDPLLGASDVEDRRSAIAATSKGKQVAAAMRDRLNRQFVPQGVQILSVMIKEIKLPENIISQMSEKTMVISRNAQQSMYHEDAMQNTRMEEEVQTMLQTFKERRVQEIATGREAINSEQVRLNDAVSQAKKSEAELREEAEVKVQTIHAGNELVIQRIRDKTRKETAKIEADAKKYCAELQATAKVEAQGLLSDAELRAAEKKATVDRILAGAEGRIASWLEKKKEHTTQLKQLQVYEKLAENEDLIVSGSSDDTKNVVAVADAILRGDQEEDESSRSVLMAELALLNTASSAFISHMKAD